MGMAVLFFLVAVVCLQPPNVAATTSPEVLHLLQVWETQLSGTPVDSLQGPAVSWDWLPSACTELPCQYDNIAVEQVDVQGFPAVQASVHRSCSLVPCPDDRAGESNDDECLIFSVSLRGTCQLTGGELSFNLTAQHAGSRQSLVDVGPSLQGSLFGLGAVKESTGITATLIDLDLVDGFPFKSVQAVSGPGSASASELALQLLTRVGDAMRLNALQATTTSRMQVRPLFVRPMALGLNVTCFHGPASGPNAEIELCVAETTCASPSACPALSGALRAEISKQLPQCPSPVVLDGGAFGARTATAVAIHPAQQLAEVLFSSAWTQATVRCAGSTTRDLRLSIKAVVNTQPGDQAMYGHLALLPDNDADAEQQAVWALIKHLPTYLSGTLQGLVGPATSSLHQLLPYDLFSHGLGGMPAPAQSPPDAQLVERFFTAVVSDLLHTGNVFVDGLVAKQFGAAAVQAEIDRYMSRHVVATDVGLLVAVAEGVGLPMRLTPDGSGVLVLHSWLRDNVPGTVAETMDPEMLARAMKEAADGFEDQYPFPWDWEHNWYGPVTVPPNEATTSNLIMAVVALAADWRAPIIAWNVTTPLGWSLKSVANIEFPDYDGRTPLFASSGVSSVQGTVLGNTVAVRHVPFPCDSAWQCWWDELFCFYYDRWYWGWWWEDWEAMYDKDAYLGALQRSHEHCFEHFAVANSADIFDIDIDQADVTGALNQMLLDLQQDTWPDVLSVSKRFDNTLSNWRSSTGAQVVGRSSWRGEFIMSLASASLQCLTLTGDRTGTREILGTDRFCVPILLATNTTVTIGRESAFTFVSSLHGASRVKAATVPFAKDLMLAHTGTSLDMMASINVHSASSDTQASGVDAQLSVSFEGVTDTNTTVKGAVYDRASSTDATETCRNDPYQPLYTSKCFDNKGPVTTVEWDMSPEPQGLPAANLYGLLVQTMPRLVYDALGAIKAPAPGLQNPLSSVSNFNTTYSNLSLWMIQPKVLSSLSIATSNQVCPSPGSPYPRDVPLAFIVNGNKTFPCTLSIDYSSNLAIEQSLTASLKACSLQWLVSGRLVKLHYNTHTHQQCSYFELRTTGYGGAFNVTVVPLSNGDGLRWENSVAFPRTQTFVSLPDASYLAQMMYNPHSTYFHQPEVRIHDVAAFSPGDIAPTSLTDLLEPHLPVWTSRLEACTHSAEFVPGNHSIHANGSLVRPNANTNVMVEMEQCINVSYGIMFRVPRLAGAEANDSRPWHRMHTKFNASALVNQTIKEAVHFRLVLGAEDRTCPQRSLGTSQQQQPSSPFVCATTPTVVPLSANVIITYDAGMVLREAVLTRTKAQLPAEFQELVQAVEMPADPLFTGSAAQLALVVDGVQLNSTTWRIPTVLGLEPVSPGDNVSDFVTRTYAPYPSQTVFTSCDVSVRGTMSVEFDGVVDIGIVPCAAQGVAGVTRFAFNMSMTEGIATTQRLVRSLRLHGFPNGYTITADAAGALAFSNITLRVLELYEHDKPKMAYTMSEQGLAFDQASLQAMNDALGAYDVSFSGPHAGLFSRLDKEHAPEMCTELQRLLRLEASMHLHPELMQPLPLVRFSLVNVYDELFNDKFAQLDGACATGAMEDLLQFCNQFELAFGSRVCQSITLDPHLKRIVVDLAWTARHATLPTTMVVDLDEIFEFNFSLPVGEGDKDRVSLVFNAAFASTLVFDFSEPEVDVVSIANTSLTMQLNYSITGDQVVHFGMLPVRFAKTQAQLQAAVWLTAHPERDEYVVDGLNSSSFMISEPSLEGAPWCFFSVATNETYLASGGQTGIQEEQIECGDGGLPYKIAIMLQKDTPARIVDRHLRLVDMMSRLSEVSPRVLYAPDKPFGAGLQHPVIKGDYDAYLFDFFARLGGPEKQQWLLQRAKNLSSVFANVTSQLEHDLMAQRQAMITAFTDLICDFTHDVRLSPCPAPPLANPDVDSLSLCAPTCDWDFVLGVSDKVTHTHLHSDLGHMSALHLQAKETFTSDIVVHVPLRFSLDQFYGPHFTFTGNPAVAVYAALDFEEAVTGRFAFIGADVKAIAGAGVFFGAGFTQGKEPTFCPDVNADPPNCIDPNNPPSQEDDGDRRQRRTLEGSSTDDHDDNNGALESDATETAPSTTPAFGDDPADQKAIELADNILTFIEGAISGCSGLEFSTGCKQAFAAGIKARKTVEDMEKMGDLLDNATKALESMSLPDITWHIIDDMQQLRQDIVEPIVKAVHYFKLFFEEIKVVVKDIEDMMCEIKLPKAALSGKVTREKFVAQLKNDVIKYLRQAGGVAKKETIHALIHQDISLDDLAKELAKSLLPVLLKALAEELLRLAVPDSMVVSLGYTVYRLADDPDGKRKLQSIIAAIQHFDWYKGGKAFMTILRIQSGALDKKCESITKYLAKASKEVPELRRRRRRRQWPQQQEEGQFPASDLSRQQDTPPWKSSAAVSATATHNHTNGTGMPEDYFLYLHAGVAVDGKLGILFDGAITELPYLEANFSAEWHMVVGDPVHAPTFNMSAQLHLGSLFTTIVNTIKDHLERFLQPAQQVVKLLQTKMDLVSFFLGRSMTLAELVPYLDEMFGGDVEEAKKLAAFVKKFLTIEADMSLMQELIDLLEHNPAHFFLGHYHIDFNTSKVDHDKPSSYKPSYPPGQAPPAGIDKRINDMMSSFMTRDKQEFAISFPILENLDSFAQNLLFGQTKFSVIEVDLPDFSHASHIPVGPFVIFPWPTIVIGGVFDFGIGVQNIRIVLPFDGFMAAVRSHDAGELLRYLSLVVKDNQGHQIYQLKAFLGFGVEVAVGFLIFEGGLELGMALEGEIGLRDIEGNGLLSVADAKMLGNLPALVVGKLDLILFLNAFVAACIPVIFSEICWTVLQWGFQWPLFTVLFGQGGLPPVATPDGRINLDAAVGMSSLVVQVLSTTTHTSIKFLPSDQGVGPGGTSRGRSVTSKAISFAQSAPPFGGDYSVMLSGFYGALELPGSSDVTLHVAMSGYPHAQQVLINQAGVTVKAGFSVTVPGACKALVFDDTLVNLAFVVQHARCALLIPSMSANNVTVNGIPGVDFTPATPVQLQSANTVLVAFEDTTLTLEDARVTSSQGGDVQLQGSTVLGLVVRGSATRSTTFLIVSTRPETATQVVGLIGDDNFVVQNMEAIPAPLLLNGGQGNNGMSMTSTPTYPTLVQVSDDTVEHAINGGDQADRRYLFTVNVGVRMLTYNLQPGANLTTKLLSLAWGQQVLVNLVGGAGVAPSTHLVDACSLGAQLKYVISGSGSHTFHVGLDDSLIAHNGVVDIGGTADPDQFVSVQVHASQDPRTLVYKLVRNMLTVIDSAFPAEALFRIAFHHVDELILELNGLVMVDQEHDATVYGTEVVIVMVNHTTIVPKEFEPTRKVWTNEVLLYGTNSPVSVHGVIDRVVIGQQPGMSPAEPGNNCSWQPSKTAATSQQEQDGNVNCLLHPLATVHAPVFLLGTEGRAMTLELTGGTSRQAGAQHMLIKGSDVFMTTSNGSRVAVADNNPSPRFCERLAAHEALCDGVSHVRFATASIQIKAATGGGDDTFYVQDTPATVFLSTGAGQDTVIVHTVSRVEADLGPDNDYFGGTFPIQGHVAVGDGINTVQLATDVAHRIQSRKVPAGEVGIMEFYEDSTGEELVMRMLDGNVDRDLFEVNDPPHVCQSCDSPVRVPPRLPPGAPEPSASFSTQVTMQDIMIHPTKVAGDVHEYAINGCNNMPFRMLAPRERGTHLVTLSNMMSLNCAVTLAGTSYHNMSVRVTATFDNSSNLHLIGDEDALHVRSVEHRSFLRVALSHIASLTISGSATGRLHVELNEMEPSMNVAALFAGATQHSRVSSNTSTKNTVNKASVSCNPLGGVACTGASESPQRGLRVQGTSSPFFMPDAGFNAIMVGSDPHPANPLSPVSHLYSTVIVSGSNEATVTVAGGSQDYAEPMRMALDGACMGVLGANGNVAPASSLSHRYNITEWLCNIMVAHGLDGALCTTTCPLTLLQPTHLLVQTGGNNDEMVVKNCVQLQSMHISMLDGDDSVQIHNCTAPFVVSQGLGNDQCSIRSPISVGTVDQGNAQDLALNNGNRLLATFGEAASVQPGTIVSGTAEILYLQQLNPNDLLEVEFDSSLPASSNEPCPGGCCRMIIGGPRFSCVSNTVYCFDEIVDSKDIVTAEINCQEASNVSLLFNLTAEQLNRRVRLSLEGSPTTLLQTTVQSELHVEADQLATDWGRYLLDTGFEFLVKYLSRVVFEAQSLSFHGPSLCESIVLLGTQLTSVNVTMLNSNALVHNCAACDVPPAYWASVDQRTQATFNPATEGGRGGSGTQHQYVFSGAASVLSTSNQPALWLLDRCLSAGKDLSHAVAWFDEVAKGLGFSIPPGCPVTVNGTDRLHADSGLFYTHEATAAIKRLRLSSLQTARLVEPTSTGPRVASPQRLQIMPLQDDSRLDAVLSLALEPVLDVQVLSVATKSKTQTSALVVFEAPFDHVTLQPRQQSADSDFNVQMLLTDNSSTLVGELVSTWDTNSWNGTILRSKNSNSIGNNKNLTVTATLLLEDAWTLHVVELDSSKLVPSMRQNTDHQNSNNQLSLTYAMANSSSSRLAIEVDGAIVANLSVLEGGTHTLGSLPPTLSHEELGANNVNNVNTTVNSTTTYDNVKLSLIAKGAALLQLACENEINLQWGSDSKGLPAPPRAAVIVGAPRISCSKVGFSHSRVALRGCASCTTSLGHNDSLVALVDAVRTTDGGSKQGPPVVLTDVGALSVIGTCGTMGQHSGPRQPLFAPFTDYLMAQKLIENSSHPVQCALLGARLEHVSSSTSAFTGAQLKDMASEFDVIQAVTLDILTSSLVQNRTTFALDSGSVLVNVGTSAQAWVKSSVSTRLPMNISCLAGGLTEFKGNLTVVTQSAKSTDSANNTDGASDPSSSEENENTVTWSRTGGCVGQASPFTWDELRGSPLVFALQDDTVKLDQGGVLSASAFQAARLRHGMFSAPASESTIVIVRKNEKVENSGFGDTTEGDSYRAVVADGAVGDTPIRPSFAHHDVHRRAVAPGSESLHAVLHPDGVAVDVVHDKNSADLPRLYFPRSFVLRAVGPFVISGQVQFHPQNQTLDRYGGGTTCMRESACTGASWSNLKTNQGEMCLPSALESQCERDALAEVSWTERAAIRCTSDEITIRLEANYSGPARSRSAEQQRPIAFAMVATALTVAVVWMFVNPKHLPVVVVAFALVVSVAAAFAPALNSGALLSGEMKHQLRDLGQSHGVCFDSSARSWVFTMSAAAVGAICFGIVLCTFLALRRRAGPPATEIERAAILHLDGDDTDTENETDTDTDVAAARRRRAAEHGYNHLDLTLWSRLFGVLFVLALPFLTPLISGGVTAAVGGMLFLVVALVCWALVFNVPLANGLLGHHGRGKHLLELFGWLAFFGMFVVTVVSAIDDDADDASDRKRAALVFCLVLSAILPLAMQQWRFVRGVATGREAGGDATDVPTASSRPLMVVLFVDVVAAFAFCSALCFSDNYLAVFGVFLGVITACCAYVWQDRAPPLVLAPPRRYVNDLDGGENL